MTSVDERGISGRWIVGAGLAVAVIVTIAAVVLGPPLREQVRQEQQPRTLREPVASGTHLGDVWEAVARYDGSANCVELRFRGEVLDRACDAGPRRTQTSLPDDGPVVAYGVAAEEVTSVEVPLDDGSVVTAPAVGGDLGFPVSFWALELPDGNGLAGPGG